MNERLTDLEIHFSHLQALLDALNNVVIRQQQQIEQLQRELATLRQQIQSGGSQIASLQEETPPPHY